MQSTHKQAASIDGRGKICRRFLKMTAIAVFMLSGVAPLGMAQAAVGKAEQTSLKFGFIKLTDMVPLAIAYEKGYFEDEGLSVTLEAQANWKVLLDRVVTGELDGAHMLAGQPIGATIGFGTKADIITAFSMDMNGNGITVSNAVWADLKKKLPMKDGKPVHPIDPKYLKAVVDDYKKQGKQFKMGMVFPVSTHNYELRYWLAAGGSQGRHQRHHQGGRAVVCDTTTTDAVNHGGGHDRWLLRG